MSNSSHTLSGISFSGALFLVLFVLKLTGVIGWSWWVVTAPIWIPWLVVGMICVLFFAALLFQD